MRKFVLSIGLVAASLGAMPATAQTWRLQPVIRNQIQSDIIQLDSHIQRASQRRTVSQREATGLRRDADQLKRTYNQYGRNGLTRGEVTALETRVNALRQRLRLERRDWDGRRG